jgi:hypothetical protein
VAERRVVKIIPPILCESEIKVLGFNLGESTTPSWCTIEAEWKRVDVARRMILLFQLVNVRLFDRY